MQLAPTEEQQAVQQEARRFLAAEIVRERRIAWDATAEGYDPPFWQAVARLGDGRVVAWRPGTRGLPGGYIVIYAPNGTPTLFPGEFGFWSVHDNRWLVGTDFGSYLYAFDIASGQFASLQTGRSIDALALLPH